MRPILPIAIDLTFRTRTLVNMVAYFKGEMESEVERSNERGWEKRFEDNKRMWELSSRWLRLSYQKTFTVRVGDRETFDALREAGFVGVYSSDMLPPGTVRPTCHSCGYETQPPGVEPPLPIST